MSSASPRVAPIAMAIGSPAKRTRSVASGGWSEALKPSICVTATMGFSVGKSRAVNTFAGASMLLMRPCATGLRTKATSTIAGRAMSATNCPAPCR